MPGTKYHLTTGYDYRVTVCGRRSKPTDFGDISEARRASHEHPNTPLCSRCFPDGVFYDPSRGNPRG